MFNRPFFLEDGKEDERILEEVYSLLANFLCASASMILPSVTPLHDGLAMQQRELTEKNRRVRFMYIYYSVTDSFTYTL